MKFEKPKFKRYVFAQEAEESTLEDVPEVQTAEKEKEGYCGYQHGFTNINMTALEQGGKPPRGTQFNQILKDITGITQYLSAGGLYPMDKDIIQSEGYPKNAIICIDGVGLFRSLMDDNKIEDYKDTSAWSMVIDFKPVRKIQRIVGEIFPAIRSDIPDGCLRCDGKKHWEHDYQYFVDKYLKTGKIPFSLSFDDWDKKAKSQEGNCGSFGIDEYTGYFRTPRIKTGTFLTNGSYSDAGTFGWDQIVNIVGSFNWTNGSQGQTEITGGNVTGVFKAANSIRSRYPHPGGHSTYYRGIDFDASRVVRTGDKVQPRNIQYPFFVVISEIFKENSGEV